MLKGVATKFIMIGLLSLCAAGQNARANTIFTYDQLGRLRTVVYDNGVRVEFSYDPENNRSIASVVSNPSTVTTWGTGNWGAVPWSPM